MMTRLLAATALGLSLLLGACSAPATEEEAASDDAALIDLARVRRPSTRPARVLVVVSAADFIWVQERDSGRIRKTPAGYFLSELGFPLARLVETGAQITFATPGGVAPTMDRVSDSPSLLYYRSASEYRTIRSLVTGQDGMQHPRALEGITSAELEGFDALFIPGGHAPMTDLAQSRDMERVLLHFHENGKPTASLCHGPAALLATRDKQQPEKPFPYAGYKMTALSDGEEQLQELLDVYDTNVRLTWYVERELSGAGADYERNFIKFTSRVVTDRELVTGQNPQSARAVGVTFTNKVADYVDGR